MNLVIKQSPNHGQDVKIFRAYTASNEGSDHNDDIVSLGVSCSCTSNPEHGAKRCAQKALALMMFGDANKDCPEIFKRLSLRESSPGIWTVALSAPNPPTLKPKNMTELDSLRNSTRAADELLAALDCDCVTFPPVQSELSGVEWKRRAQEIALEAREILQVRLGEIERSHLP